MLNKELSQFSESSKSGNQISEYIFSTFLDKQHDMDPGTEEQEPFQTVRRHTPSPEVSSKKKIMSKITIHQVRNRIYKRRRKRKISKKTEILKRISTCEEKMLKKIKRESIAES